MGDQPGAGRSYSYKIKGHSRERRSAKPYSRPSDHKKGVLESVKDFFSPSWLLDYWKGKKIVTDDDVEDSENDEEGEEPLQTSREYSGPSGRLTHEGIAGTSTEIFGNGGLGIVASAQNRNETSPKSGFSSLLSLRSITSGKNETLETRTTGFASSVSETTKSYHDYSQTPTTDSSSATETRTEMEPLLKEVSKVPTSSTSSRSEPTSSLFRPIPGSTSTPEPTSSLFGPLPGSSTTTSQEKETPGLSLLSARPQFRSVFHSRPEFSVSAFGSPLPPRPSSHTGRYSSPYYSGKTVFGGAASNMSKRARVSSPSSLEHAKPVKRQIRPTPISGPGVGGVASQTAKRILETLEKMSSPLVDAKKIPPSPPSTSSSPLSFTQSRRRKPPQQPYSRPVGSPRKLEARFGAPPVQSLSVPQRASISRIKTDTMATTTTQIKSTPLTTTYIGQSSSKNTTKPSFVPTPLPMSLSPMETAKGGGGKIRAAKTSTTHYKATVEEEEEVINPLPVITSAVPFKLPRDASLPSFSFPTSKPTIKTTSNKQSKPAFSTTKSKPADISCNNFKFSIPEPKNSTSNVCSSSKSSPHKTVEYSFSNPASVTTSETSTTECSETSTTERSKVVLSLDKFKPAEGSWECSECLVNNKADITSCIACTTPKPSSKPPSLPSNNLFKKFQPPSGSWSCNSCMLSNKATDKCIACEAPKPLSSEKGKVTITKGDNLLKTFATPSDSWECPTCMINNKGQDVKCVACQETKPGSKPTSDTLLSKQFAPARGSWTCDTCMIVNKPDIVKCLACETPKPGASAAGGVANSSFNFGSSDSNSKGDATFTFGQPPSGSTSDSNPFKLGPTATCSPFVFGTSTTTSNHGKTVTFGSSETVSSSKPFQLGSTAAYSNSATFKFGSSQDSSKVETYQFGKTTDSKPSTSEATSTFKFGSAVASTEKQSTVQFGSSLKPESSKLAPFSFGVSKSPLKKTATSQVEKEAPNKTTTPSQPPLKVGQTSIAQAAAVGQTSIAQAAAAGLLKIPSAVDVVDLTSDDKPQQKITPPNVNIFAGQSLPTTSQILTTSTGPTKPEVSTTTSSLPSLPSAFLTTKPTDPSKANPFSFTPVVTSSTQLSTFWQTPVATTTAVTGFAFGTAVESTDKAVSSATVPSFSAIPQQGNALSAFTDATKSTATSTISSSPFAFKGSTDAAAKFGSTSSTTNSSSGFMFGGAASSGGGGGSFAFGGANAASQPGSSAGGTPPTFVFGANTGQTQKSGFAFGSSTQPFAFGSTPAANPIPVVPQTVSEESMDADGNNNNSQSTAPSFGTSVAAPSATSLSFPPASGNTGFNFSGVQQPAAFKFGATDTTPPVFGGTDRLGSSTAPTFGAPTGNPSQQGASGGFNFNPPAANSISSQPAGAFTMGAGATNTTRRVIKRGIRRSKQRP